jgi:hypothetical protein
LTKFDESICDIIPKLNYAKPEVNNRFEDGRCCHLGNSSASYKMVNYHPNFMKVGTQTEKRMLSSKNAKVGSMPFFFKKAAAANLEINETL